MDLITGAWVAFAKDPQSGLQKYGWPQFNDKFQGEYTSL